MNPPITTTLALVQLSLRPLAEALGHIKSYNGPVVFVRDRHYTDRAAVIASYPARVASKRLQFVRSTIEGRSVDLTASALGETFTTKQPSLQQSRMNRQHIVWGAYLPLPNNHEAVIQLAFDKTIGAAPSLATIVKAWDDCRPEIVEALQALATLSVPSLIDACRLNVPVTPNAFVLKWDIMDSSHVARTNYGELRHFITTFESTIRPLVEFHGGHITSYRGDAQNIILSLPTGLNRSSPRELTTFARRHVTPLIDKIRIAHETIAQGYNPVIRLRLGVGLGAIETSQLGEETGPILWDIASKMKMRATSSDLFVICVDDSARDYLAK
ncbi:hypothetical protein KA093_01835 [Candidatus Saccharibacteria bacterium]|nr:hypothetical protein [Candidatus Saccharibacteria bacterium]